MQTKKRVSLRLTFKQWYWKFFVKTLLLCTQVSDGQLKWRYMWFIYHSCSCFSLSFSISKQEEWELLFCYVLQYPLVVKEAGSLEKSGIGVHVEVGIKKVKHNTLVALVTVISRVYPLLQICLFLIKLSRAFSSYYSRVKILMVGVCLCICLVHSSVCLPAMSLCPSGCRTPPCSSSSCKTPSDGRH